MPKHLVASVGAAVALALSAAVQAQPASAPKAEAASAAPAPPGAPAAPAADVSEGKVAYYGRKFNGRRTASGERFDAGALTMAHRTLPFGTQVRVTNTDNGQSVVVRVNDRGPSTPDRVGDLSSAAARRIGMIRAGVVDVQLEVIQTGKPR